MVDATKARNWRVGTRLLFMLLFVVSVCNKSRGQEPAVILPVGKKQPVHALAFSRDGRLLAAACQPDLWEVRLWDVAAKREVACLKGHTGEINSVAFSPDDKLLASGGGMLRKPGEIILWDIASGKQKACLEGHKSEVECVAF